MLYFDEFTDRNRLQVFEHFLPSKQSHDTTKRNFYIEFG